MTAEHGNLPVPECRAVVWGRCQGLCELCGEQLRPDQWEAHHRRLRSAGGLWCPCTVIALHPRCHNQHRDSVHDNPLRSKLTGHLVSRYAEPREQALQLPTALRFPMSGPTVLLSCGGTYV